MTAVGAVLAASAGVAAWRLTYAGDADISGPANWAMMILGFGIGGAVLRRRIA